MNQLKDFFLAPYKSSSLYIRKKVKFFLFFLTMILTVSIGILGIEFLAVEYSHYKLLEFSAFFTIFIIIYALVRIGKLEWASNGLILAGIFRAMRLFFYTLSIQFYGVLFIIVLSVGVIHTRKYQLWAGFSLTFCLALLRTVFYGLNRSSGELHSMFLFQSVYLLMILFVFIVMVHFLVRIIEQEITGTRKLKNMAYTDALTGVFNRRMCDSALQKALIRMERENRFFAFFMIDLDYFKQVNDEYGHNTGDKVLQQLVKCLHKALRKEDPVYRWGGEEFVIIAPDLNLKNALILGERLREDVFRYHFSVRKKLTISLGCTISREGDTPDSIVNRADAALYKAKDEGRNRLEWMT